MADAAMPRDDERAGTSQDMAPNPEPKQLPPCIIMFYGRGTTDWHPDAKALLMSHSTKPDLAQALAEIKNHMTANTFFFGPAMVDGVTLAVLKHPIETKKKAEKEEWVRWWLATAKGWKTEVVRLVSPSAEYDSLVKLVAREQSIDCIVTDPAAKPEKRYKCLEKPLDQLRLLKLTQKWRISKEKDDEVSIIGDPETNTDHEEPVQETDDEEKEDEGEERKENADDSDEEESSDSEDEEDNKRTPIRQQIEELTAGLQELKEYLSRTPQPEQNSDGKQGVGENLANNEEPEKAGYQTVVRS
ncbi:histone H2A.Z-specific chaperone CHZ1, partial [Austrofundulus limnaeus]|uniref:Histone H2A.Z-specific chaperone CHZ1 n=1 Tax=Austrofundulus limnaeus TaxID=52670 RepID=A0A2I4AM25_AUSLI